VYVLFLNYENYEKKQRENSRISKLTKKPSLQGIFYPASKVLSYFFSARHGEARETLQNVGIFFVEPTIEKLG
jgi:hypothetical protein